jgi:hypothetical protein
MVLIRMGFYANKALFIWGLPRHIQGACFLL